MGFSKTLDTYTENLNVQDYDGSALSGLVAGNFTSQFFKDDVAQAALTPTIVESATTPGIYLYSVDFPEAGSWRVEVVVNNGTEDLEEHILSVEVVDTLDGGIIVEDHADPLGTVSRMDFEGTGVSVDMDGEKVVVTIEGQNQIPEPSIGDSSISASYDGEQGTLTFSSRSEQ